MLRDWQSDALSVMLLRDTFNFTAEKQANALLNAQS